VVGDQLKILGGQREFLARYGKENQVMFATGAQEALATLSSMPFEAVVTDMLIPKTEDGTLFLERVKEEYPEVIRLTLCPQWARDMIFLALPISHQVLPKPCDAKTLNNSIERACRLRALLTDSLLQRVGNIEKLPSLPAVYQELMSAMSRPDVSIQTIARIVERDAAMAAKTLQLVNSACFSVSCSITRVDQAVTYLGMELIKNLSLTVHVFSALEPRALRSGFSFEAQQEHALMTARIARQLLWDQQKSQDAFTAALLHDIGKLVLAVCIPAKFTTVVQACKTTGRPQHQVEAELLGVTHAEVGAYLLALWGLPLPIVEAVAYHHNPSAAIEHIFDIPSAVSLANSLVSPADSPANLHEHLHSLGVSSQLDGWTEVARQEMGRVNERQTVKTGK
jgi:HD-like signal output (HDOD) protein